MTVLFPSIRPSSRSFTAADYPVTSPEYARGVAFPRLRANRPNGAVLELAFNNITDVEAASIIACYVTARGEFHQLDLPLEIVAGIDMLALKRRIIPQSALCWHFSEPPKVDAVLTGISNVTVRLIASLDPNGAVNTAVIDNTSSPTSYFALLTGLDTSGTSFFHEYSYNVKHDNNNAIYLGGRSYFYQNYALVTGQSLLVKLDVSGNFQWGWILVDATFSGFNDFNVLSVDNSNALFTASNLDDGAGFFKFSYSGLLLWQRKLLWHDSTFINSYISGSVINADGSCTMLAYKTDYNFTAVTWNLIKYSSGGTLLWQKELGGGITWPGQGSYSIPYALAKDTDNNYYAGGTTYAPNSNLETVSALVKFNPSGSVLWKKAIYTPNSTYPNEVINALVVDGFNNLYALISSYTFELDRVVNIVKISSSGSIVWQKRITNYGSYIDCYGMAIDSSGNLYITGSLAHEIPSYTENGLIFKLDSTGNLLWSRQFDTEDFEYGISIDIDSNGDMLITGAFYFWALRNTEDLNVIKLPADGTKTGVYGSFSYTAVGLEITNSSLAITDWTQNYSYATTSYTETAGNSVLTSVTYPVIKESIV